MENDEKAATKKEEAQQTSCGKKVLLALASTLISLLLIEGVLRFAKREVAFQPDPELGRSLRPNTHTKIWSLESDDLLNGRTTELPPKLIYQGNNNTNNIAFRMGEDVGPKAPDEARVLIVGDSFTEGDSVAGDKRFTALVDQRLRAATAAGPRHVHVLNGAIQNGTPAQYILQLRRWLPELEPDVVIVALAPNDINDDLLFENLNGFTFDADGVPIGLKATTRLWLLQKSYVLRYFHVVLQRTGSRGAMDFFHFFFPSASPGTKIIDWKDILCKEDAVARETFTKKTGKYLRKIKEMVEASGARLGVFMIHYMWTFDDEPYYGGRFPTYEVEMKECYASHARPYNEFIEGYLKESGIPFQNPYAALLRAKAENPKRKLWHFVDYHYSPAGNQVVAEELYAFLKRLL